MAAPVVVATLAACGGGSNTPASHSASAPRQSPSTEPLAGPYGVLVTAPQGNYTVSLVTTSGKIAAQATTAGFPQPFCSPQVPAAVPLPVSTSDTRVYFLDGQGVVEFLTPAGETGRATTVPAGTGSRRAMFAVSPDDQRIAVVVDDYTSTGASTRLYVEDLNGGGNHLDLFHETGAYTLWPIGWHGTNNLVLAKVPSCPQGSGTFCCGPQELHVVDPATATRRFTLGGPSCVLAGPPSQFGAVCENAPDFSKATVLTWTAAAERSVVISKPTPAYLSPNGNLVAVEPGPDTAIAGTNVNFLGVQACTWIDDSHLLSRGDQQGQPKIEEFPSGVTYPVAAKGDCGGRIPGGL